MPETIPSTFRTKKNELHSLTALVWLLEIDLDGTNSMCVAGYDANLSHDGKTWTAFPIELGEIPRDADGNLPLIEVTVSNLSREAAYYLEQGGVVDRLCHLRLLNTETPTEAMDWGSWSVQDAQVHLAGMIVRLGPYALLDAPLPGRVQNRGKCDYQFGDDECGFDTTLPNAIAAAEPDYDETVCALTLRACRQHGRNEVANGKPRRHPGRFGAHPGIPKGPAQ